MKKYNNLFNKNGFILLRNVLSNKQKTNLLNYVNQNNLQNHYGYILTIVYIFRKMERVLLVGDYK